MVLELLHDTFWGSQAAAAGTGVLLAMAACIWAMNLGNERTITVRRVASLGACPVRALKDWIDATAE